MLHDGNRIFNHPRSEESIQLLREYLIKSHKDKDDDSLWVRFGELLRRIEDLEISAQASWNTTLAIGAEYKKLKDELDFRNDEEAGEDL